ncbi:formamidopyrimidine-DNA glycosylase [Bacilli bacterium PM5-3]|nr:formamidopyrimidine-DNA glycosylase [Bacilli bacterium PM5-3]MDH6603690.1 formamidopyrimidine-DNA glycosylase [Bacilli bacterium PM5-9]
MIELPEAIVLAKQLKENVLNKKIVKIITKESPHRFAFFNDEVDYEKELVGKQFIDAYNHAGIVELKLDESFLTLRDGTNIRYYKDKSLLPKKHQLLIEFEDESYLVVSVQMYGEINLSLESREHEFYYQICKLNSNPSHDDFTFEYFSNMLANCDDKLSIKAALATEQRIPGIGNGVLQDILFKARINPKTKLSLINQDQRKELYNVMMELIAKMIELGGRNTEKDIFNDAGGYEVILSSKTYKNGCPICKGEITKQAYLGGSVYFCENEQPLLK